MEDDKSLASYSIQKEATLHLIERVPADAAPPLEAVAGATSTSDMVAALTRIASSVASVPPTVSLSKTDLIAAVQAWRKEHADEWTDEIAGLFGTQALAAFGERESVRAGASSEDGAAEWACGKCKAANEPNATACSLCACSKATAASESQLKVGKADAAIAAALAVPEGKEADAATMVDLPGGGRQVPLMQVGDRCKVSIEADNCRRWYPGTIMEVLSYEQSYGVVLDADEEDLTRLTGFPAHRWIHCRPCSSILPRVRVHV